MMKKPVSRKRKIKGKSTQYFCRTCIGYHVAKRNDAKGSLYCKKVESMYRISKGYIHQIKKELKNGLLEFCDERPKLLGQNPFKKEINTFIKAKSVNEMLLPWRQEFDSGFILYYYPHLKKRQYDIFYTEKKKLTWERYLKQIALFYGEKKIYKNLDMESGRQTPPRF